MNNPIYAASRGLDGLDEEYDFIICGAGSSGCVVASRLAENPAVRVLLIEAGGSDLVPEVLDGTVWPSNVGSERDWCFRGEPVPSLNNRRPSFPMGKVLGGGSSINGLVWARGHRNDFEGWASETGNPRWNYESVLDIYRRIENWEGPQSDLRGRGGPVTVTLPRDPVNPVAIALLEAAQTLGIPGVSDLNAEAMEGDGAAGLTNVIMKDGRRVSVSAAYIHPALDRQNLTVVLETQVVRLRSAGTRITGVDIVSNGREQSIRASREVVLSTGAIKTPQLLMLSGIGPEGTLKRLGVPRLQALEGVGSNFQDHLLFGGCMWEYVNPEPSRNNSAEFTFFSKSGPSLPTPDLQPCFEEYPYATEATRERYAIPEGGWVLAPGLVKPTSRGSLTLASASVWDSPIIHAEFLSTEADMVASRRAFELCRELGNSPLLKPFVKREVMPGPLQGKQLDSFIRDAAATYFHESGTCKMGRDAFSVVDGALKVYGVKGLRVADASVMPTITTGNTMAPCVVIGERCADEIREEHGI